MNSLLGLGKNGLFDLHTWDTFWPKHSSTCTKLGIIVYFSMANPIVMSTFTKFLLSFLQILPRKPVLGCLIQLINSNWFLGKIWQKLSKNLVKMDTTIGFAMEKYTIIPSLVQVDECLGQNVSNSHFRLSFGLGKFFASGWFWVGAKRPCPLKDFATGICALIFIGSWSLLGTPLYYIMEVWNPWYAPHIVHVGLS